MKKLEKELNKNEFDGDFLHHIANALGWKYVSVNSHPYNENESIWSENYVDKKGNKQRIRDWRHDRNAALSLVPQNAEFKLKKVSNFYECSINKVVARSYLEPEAIALAFLRWKNK